MRVDGVAVVYNYGESGVFGLSEWAPVVQAVDVMLSTPCFDKCFEVVFDVFNITVVDQQPRIWRDPNERRHGGIVWCVERLGSFQMMRIVRMRWS